MVTGLQDDVEAEKMTVEQMIAMKEGLEAQIKAMKKPSDKVTSLGRFTFATRNGIEEEDPPPRRIDVGQMYQVLAKFVAVRSAPTMEAPFLRRFNEGAKVEMFEWDSTRRWRRVSVDCATVSERKPVTKLTEAQRRWASEAPHWDNDRGCWVDRSKKVEVVDDDEDLVMKKDGWILVQHPDMGLLLQALSGDVEETAPPMPNPPEGEISEPKVVLRPTSKEETFDYYWGTSSKVPVTFQAKPRKSAEPVVQESTASLQVGHEFETSGLGESSLADAILSAVDNLHKDDEVSDPGGVSNRVDHGSTRYRVVYKKVAVRKQPNTKSEALRQLPQGEIVEMYEWDESHCWRRIRILAIRDEGGMQESDGWMLIESPNVGRLLEEVEGDDNDDDFAG